MNNKDVRAIGVDVGGTFTDLVYLDPSGELVCEKLLSDRARSGASTLQGFDKLAEALGPSVLTSEGLQHTHSSTIATNALIERTGGKVGLIVTEGFRDILELQRLRVPDPLRYDSTRPVPLVPRSLVREVKGRLAADGREIDELEVSTVEAAADELLGAGAELLVVCLMHSYTNPTHELRVREIVQRTWPQATIDLSHELWPQAREYERSVLAVINTYLRPIIEHYLDQLGQGLIDRGVRTEPRVMRSNGGMQRAATIRSLPAAMVLSGPAGGVAGAARAAEEAGWSAANLVTLDVGGTSADIGIIEHGFPVLSSDEHVADFPILLPTVAVSSIGAGGGSILTVDGAGAIRVGPKSLGADPGPACYGNQRHSAALTDAFLVSGWLDAEQPLAGYVGLDADGARTALSGLAERLGSTIDAVADGAISVAAAMTAAETMTILARRGIDAPRFNIVAYGGAGPLLGALVADALEVRTVLIPPLPGATSAFGAALANVEGNFLSPVYRAMSGVTPDDLTSVHTALTVRTRDWLDEETAATTAQPASWVWTASMRYVGQGYDIEVPIDAVWLKSGEKAPIISAFHETHRMLYGHEDPVGDVWMSAVRTHVVAKVPRPSKIVRVSSGEGTTTRRRVRIAGRDYDAAVMHRDNLPASLLGPAIVYQMDCTTLVPPAWTARRTESGALILEFQG